MSLKSVLTGIADKLREYYGEVYPWGGLDEEYEPHPIKLEQWGYYLDYIVGRHKTFEKLEYEKGVNQGKAEGKKEGKVEGKQEQYDLFWDTFQEKGKRKTYNHAFYVPHTSYATALPCWNDDTFRPKYPIICRAGNGGDYMLTFSMVTRISVRIEVYRYNSQTEKLLYNNPYLETVEELWVQDGCTFNNWFTNDTALKRLKMAPGSVISNDINFVHCPLDLESLLSIVDSLYNFNRDDPANAYSRTVKFNSECLELLDATPYQGHVSCLGYLMEKGWNF